MFKTYTYKWGHKWGLDNGNVTTSNEQIIIATPVLLSAAQRLIKAARPSHYSLLIAARPGAGDAGGRPTNGYRFFSVGVQ